MSSKVFNRDAVSDTLFLNKQSGLSIQRFDDPKYPVIFKLLDQQLGFFWRPEEIDMSKDRSNFSSLTKAQEHIVISNIKRQIMLDSIMGRAPDLVFGVATSDPTLEACVKWWSAYETLHSKSYTHIIQSSFSQPKEVLDTVLDIKEIVTCSDSIAKYYDDAIEKVQLFYENKVSRYEACKAIYLALHAANSLEALRFHISFACSFAFGKNGVLPGLARIITLIARDEKVHVAITNNLIKIVKNDDPDIALIAKDPEVIKAIKEMWRTVILEEAEWAKYLFKEGEIFGLNEKILFKYLCYLATTRLEYFEIGTLEEVAGFESVHENPIVWINKWLGNDMGDQPAPQEVEITTYEKGIVDYGSGDYREGLTMINLGLPDDIEHDTPGVSTKEIKGLFNEN